MLVPVVYLSAADRAKTTSAAMIAGNTVSIDAASVDNSGAIAAADGMTINAGSIKANGGAFVPQEIKGLPYSSRRLLIDGTLDDFMAFSLQAGQHDTAVEEYERHLKPKNPSLKTTLKPRALYPSEVAFDYVLLSSASPS